MTKRLKHNQRDARIILPRRPRPVEKGFSTNMANRGFDFSWAMEQLCRDIVGRHNEFSHVRMDQVAVTFAQARRRVPYGLQAKLTPMRFEGGSLTTSRYGREWTVQRLYDHSGENEYLYILTFYLPRFLDHDFREKMITIVHELHHISPHFDGDIRRHSGRYHVHSHSQKEYDAMCARLVDQYLKQKPPAVQHQFLKTNFRKLAKQHGGVVGIRLPVPKLIPLRESA